MTVRRLSACCVGSRYLVRVVWLALPISSLEPSAARKPSTGRIGVDVNRRSVSDSAPSP